MPFALIAAALASLGIHGAALFLTGVDLALSPEPVPLQAEIVLQPRVMPETAKSPEKTAKAETKPRPSRRPPRSSTYASAAPAIASPAATMPMPANEPAPSAEPGSGAAPAVSPGLPASGSIRYTVGMGPTSGPIGRATQEWEMRDGRYRLTSVAETAGLVALIKSVRAETESRGRLTDKGLEPLLFTSRVVGRNGGDRVEFDREAKLLRYANGDQSPLPDGVQDLLSLNYQLGWLARTGEMAITTGRKLGRYPLEVLAEEMLDTPMGPMRTLHFRAAGETTTEVWLATEKYLLPVKIRHIDKRGEIFEQLANDIVLPE